MAALGSQSIASSYEQLLHVDSEGGGNGTTHVSVKAGDNGTTFGFTIASDALMMSSTNRLEFGDTGTYIHQSADGVLDLVSDTEIEINATTIDMNGAADLSGNLTVGGDIDLEGSIDVNGTSNLDAVDIDGAVQIDSTVTVGADDQGYDVIFYGDTASSNMTWDTSADDLILNDSRLFIDQDDNATCFSIDAENTTNNVALIQADALTTAHGFKVASDSSSTGTRDLVRFVNDNASANATNVLFIDQDADHHSIVIDSEATTGYAIHIDDPATTTADVIRVASANALTTGSIANFYSNSSDTNTRNLVLIDNDNAAADATTCLRINQDGDGPAISLIGAGGGGIKFQASAQNSSDANTLDDYEEGTWTPAGSLKSVLGFYTKIGQIVICEAYMQGDSTSDATLTGLPFTCRNSVRALAGGVTTSTAGGPYAARVINNSATFNIVTANTNQTFGDNQEIWALIIYKV